ncbi:NUDIX hydrolase [Paenibacillus larvae]|nr:NUDIX hydrolase [Paenibacillus larvae]MDT2287821.1 NUDIX hydrolase [Paenibacillus larvae]
MGAVGGHVEPGEIRNPRAACLREIQEETGIEENQIKQFRLQYILIRLNQQELRQQFLCRVNRCRTQHNNRRRGFILDTA